MKGKFFLISIILCIYSCTLEDDAGYYSDSFGVVRLFNDHTPYIESDEGKILIPSQSISSFVRTGDRVWISYTVENENKKQDTLTILPNRIAQVMPLNLQSESKPRNDGVDLWTVWIAQDFLTFDFRIRAINSDKIKEHEYALVSTQKEITDTLHIDFQHDAKGDTYGVLCRTAVALKLSDLNIASDSAVIVIDYNNLDGIKHTEYVMYRKIQN
ncbi:MAG: hypothetical protein LBK97_08070 [Prevotellaceae bacterium]|jgi:hypothetical protein|nr:hypothetical protein [Prevotellaceae bacterium]